MNASSSSSDSTGGVRPPPPPPRAPGTLQPTLHELEVAELESLIRFLATKDSSLIYLACSKTDIPGVNGDLLVNIVCSRTKLQLHMLSEAFKAQHGVSLRDAITRKRTGSYVPFLKYCCIPRTKFLAALLEEALLTSEECDVGAINEIFCLNNNKDIKAMISHFNSSNSDKSLVGVLELKLSGAHRYLMLAIARYGHISGPVNHNVLASDLEALLSTDSQVVAELFARSSREHIEALKDLWKTRFPKVPLDAALRRNLEPALGTACSLLLSSPVDIYALKLKRELNSTDVDRVVVSRTLGGIDKFLAHAVFERFKEVYKMDLAELLIQRLDSDLAAAIRRWATSDDPSGCCFHYPGIPAAAVVPAIENIKDHVAEMDALMLNFAVKGENIDKKLMITTLCARSKLQLARVDMIYQQNYGLSLRDYVRQYLFAVSDFFDFLLMSDADADAHVLINNLSEDVSDEDLILEILCLRPPHRFAYAKSFYERLSGCSLIAEFGEKFGDDFAHLCQRLINGARNGAGSIDPSQIAQVLHDRGFREDLGIVFHVFSKYNFKQLNEIASAYELAYNHPLLSDIKTHFGGIVRKTLIYLLCDPIDLFCKKLKDAINDPDVKKDVINRIIGGTDKSVVQTSLIAKYEEKYGISLVDAMFEKLRGDYRSVVVTYVTSSDITDGLEMKRLYEIKRTGVASSYRPAPPQAPTAAAPSTGAPASPAQASPPPPRPPPPPPPPRHPCKTAPPPPPSLAPEGGSASPVQESTITTVTEGNDEELEHLRARARSKAQQLPPLPRPNGYESDDESVVSAASAAAGFANSKTHKSTLFSTQTTEGSIEGSLLHSAANSSWMADIPAATGEQGGSTGLPEPMKGWAQKEGHIFLSWKRRYFVLESNPVCTVISYYVNPGKSPTFGSELKGAMTLRCCDIIQIDDSTIHIKGKGDGEKDLKMRFDSAELLQKWTEMLRIHLDYRTKIDAIYKKIGGIHSVQTLNGKIV